MSHTAKKNPSKRAPVSTPQHRKKTKPKPPQMRAARAQLATTAAQHASTLVSHDRLTRLEARLDRIEHHLTHLIKLWSGEAEADLVDPNLGIM